MIMVLWSKKNQNFPAGDRELNSGFSASQPDQARRAVEIAPVIVER